MTLSQTMSFAEIAKKPPTNNVNSLRKRKFEKPKSNLGSPQNTDIGVYENVRETSHAKDRRKERGVRIPKLYISDILKLPVYTKDGGCTKYLDIKNNCVYYVREDGYDRETGKKKYKITTHIENTNPIQMLRYYAFGKKLDFNCLCRDHAFGTCTRGAKCRYIHING